MDDRRLMVLMDDLLFDIRLLLLLCLVGVCADGAGKVSLAVKPLICCSKIMVLDDLLFDIRLLLLLLCLVGVCADGAGIVSLAVKPLICCSKIMVCL